MMMMMMMMMFMVQRPQCYLCVMPSFCPLAQAQVFKIPTIYNHNTTRVDWKSGLEETNVLCPPTLCNDLPCESRLSAGDQARLLPLFMLTFHACTNVKKCNDQFLQSSVD